MTDQINLGLIWASGGGVTPVTTIKYEDGWIAEIPSFQNFNYMVQGLDENILHYAEESYFDWEAIIPYQPGARVVRTGVVYTCKLASIGNDPALDASNTYWVHGWLVGSDFSDLTEGDGFMVALPTRVAGTYTGLDVNVVNNVPTIGLETLGATENLALANVGGEACVMELGTAGPDSRDTTIGSANTHRIFHEGHPPTAAEVTDAVEEAAADSKLYARKNGAWVEVSATIIQEEPAPASTGNGDTWYNLTDGQTYMDIDDGSSTQWVLLCPPVIPEYNAEATSYDDTDTGLGANVQAAIDRQYERWQGVNFMYNTGFTNWLRGNPVNNISDHSYGPDRWYYNKNATGEVINLSKLDISQEDNGELLATSALNIELATVPSTGTVMLLTQRLPYPECAVLCGQTVSLSFWGKADVAQPGIPVSYLQHFGTGGSADVSGSFGTLNLGTTWEKFKAEGIAMPSISSKTVGDTQEASIDISLALPYASTFDIQLSQFKLEIGERCSTYKVLDRAEENLRCGRFYEEGRMQLGGQAANGVAVASALQYTVKKRMTAAVTKTLISSSRLGTISVAGQSNGIQFSATATGAGTAFSFQVDWDADSELYY